MRTSILWLVGGVALIFGAIVIYALSRGLNVKASLKILWAAFSFETTGAVGHSVKSLKGAGLKRAKDQTSADGS
jgi:hypothetical protein